jgi:hypothetical protein
MSKLEEVTKAILGSDLQQDYISPLKRHPVLHFSDNAANILRDGFTRGEASACMLACTHVNGVPKDHPGPGFNFAFNTLEWDIENECFDYEVGVSGDRGLMGMFASTAVLLNVDGIYTRHADEFHQVIFWGPDAKVENALLLTDTGELLEDGQPVCDENGNPVTCWEATNQDGSVAVSRGDGLTLRECVFRSLLYMESVNQLHIRSSRALREVYEEDIYGLDYTVPEIQHFLQKTKTIFAP